ncbi:PHP domain-containing protein [Myxococcota bacterium]|nr:PHP domain-containing protein [Myxococcota bacterium]MBU1428978.1 PHP domain-containing protein [Myxococcota bacterium]MBU1897646.1 PHP domain-containing protein [Myxococcota bacterium]
MSQARFPIDLHMHSTRSDGDRPPARLVEMAAARGVRIIALTDHDSVAGLEEARAASEGLDVTVLAGIELSTWRDQELHILGYDFDPLYPPLVEIVAHFAGDRLRRAAATLDKLDALGCPLDHAAVLSSAKGVIGRPHIAQALVEAGHVRAVEDAFRRFLRNGGPAYVPLFRLPSEAAIALIHEAGGVASLAHPGVEDADHLIPALVEAGLDAIEAHHPAHSDAQVRHYQALAARLGVGVSGGSDFHHDEGRASLGDCGLLDLSALRGG